MPDRVILLGLDIKMFYGGPKEAVMHAIYRQNFGFTDIIIGRNTPTPRTTTASPSGAISTPRRSSTICKAI